MQRLRLAAQLGAGLTGALYVLDEPTIACTRADTARLLDNLKELWCAWVPRSWWSSTTPTRFARADHLIDLGPAVAPTAGASWPRARRAQC